MALYKLIKPGTIFLSAFICFTSTVRADPAHPDSLKKELHYGSFTKQSISLFPFRDSYQKYFSLFSGVAEQTYRWDRWVHVRGSRHDQIGYSIDGIDIRSGFTGEPVFFVLPEALKSMGLDKEPGAWVSSCPALFYQHIKTGTEKFGISMSAESDGFTPLYQKKIGTYSYGFKNITGTVSGPVLTDKIRFFAAGRFLHFDDHFRKFWDGFTFTADKSVMREPDFYDNPRTFKEFFGTDTIRVKPGNIPAAWSDKYDLQAKISADFNPLYINLIGLYSAEKKSINRYPVMNLFNTGRIPLIKKESYLVSMQNFYKPSRFFKGSLKINLFSDFLQQVDPLFGDNFLLYADSAAIAQKGIDVKYHGEEQGYFKSPYSFYTSFGFIFNVPGDDITFFQKQQETGLTINLDAELKKGAHIFKAGTGFDKRTVRIYSVKGYDRNIKSNVAGLCNYIYSEHIDKSTDISGEKGIGINQYVTTFGYDGLGNPTDKSSMAFDGPRRPVTIYGYIEDTFKKDIVEIYTGLRFDRFSTHALVFPDPKMPPEPICRLGRYFQNEDKFTNAKPQTFFQPRIRMTVTLSSQIQMHVSWGKYAQIPQFKNIYATRYQLMDYVYDGYLHFNVQGPYAGAATTTQTEAGISCMISSCFSGSVTAFNLTSSNLLEYGHQNTLLQEDYLQKYPVLKNSGILSSKGLEISGTFYKNGFLLKGNYTISQVTGTSTYPMSVWYDNDYFETNPHTAILRPLEYNQPRMLNLLCLYKSGQNAALPVRNITASLLFQYTSGHSFYVWDGSVCSCCNTSDLGGLLLDYDPRCRGSRVAEILTPPVYTFDAKIEKSFYISSIRMSAYIYAHNLFNRKNILHVYWRTGSADSDGYLQKYHSFLKQYYPDEYFTLYNIVNNGHRQHFARAHGGDLYGHPREIRFGISFSVN